MTDTEARGVAFPLLDDGSRSTSATGRAVFADAARTVDAALADEIEAARDWRNSYLGFARRLLESRLHVPADTPVVASAGLESLHRRFVFVRDGDSMPLDKATADSVGPALQHAVVQGQGTERPSELSVPYRGRRLAGDALHRQLDAWMEAGTVEPSFATAIRTVMDNPDWLDLSDRTVVVLGAGAQMGPLFSLCRWGADVIPVDLARESIWLRIIETVREGTGRAFVPTPEGVPASASDADIARVAGVDLVEDLPAVAQWLASFEGPLTVGNYVYADGATHVRVSMAVDAITAALLDGRDGVSLAVLATPTDVFAVPEETVEDSRRRFADPRLPSLVSSSVRAATRGRLFAPNYERLVTTADGARLGVADCLVKQQGPNYALAKRLQRWRATVARSNGVVTSVNVAPPTRTRSVLRNRVLAAAYAGAGAFGVEVFDPSTSNTLMAAMLVHDLRNPASVANPQTPLEHPLQLFWDGANHGGLWRNPYAARSVLGMAVVLGMIPRSA